MSKNKDKRKLKVCVCKDKLTKKEEEVKASLLKGLKPKQIAEHLVLGVCTVQTHCKNIYSKLRLKGQVELMASEIKRLNQIVKKQEKEICELKKLSLNAA